MAKTRKTPPKWVLYLQYLPVAGLYHLVRMLPLKVAYAISGALFKLVFLLDRKHHNRTIQHLMHAGVAKNRAEAEVLGRKCYKHFSMLLIEIFKHDQLIKDDSVRIIGNAECARQCGAYGDEGRIYKNIIIATAHYGNWEIAGGFWARHVHTPMLSVMRPFNNPYIGELILKSRRSPEHELVDKSGGFRAAFKALKQGKSLALLVDQHANHTEGVETMFFNQPCRTHASVALLHLKTGVPIIPEVTRRRNDNFEFEFVVGNPIIYSPTDNQEQDIKIITQMITSELERLISECPEQWLWAHRRWLNINRDRKKAFCAQVTEK